MIIATQLGCGNAASIALAVVLAFVFGYSLTLGPVLRANVPFRRAAGLAFASDTLSITTMEIVDNAFILIVPGAIAAGLGDALFWWSLGVSLRDRLRCRVPGQPLADRARPRPRGRARTAHALAERIVEVPADEARRVADARRARPRRGARRRLPARRP